MKHIILSLLLLSSTITAMENPENSLAAVEEQVNAAAQAIHDHAVQGAGRAFFERCSEGIVVGVAVQILGFIALDLYHGSKGYTYKMLFGAKPEERKIALEIEELRFKNEALCIANADAEYKNYGRYKTIMEERIAQCSDQSEKEKLLERLHESTDLLARKQEFALQTARTLKAR